MPKRKKLLKKQLDKFDKEFPHFKEQREGKRFNITLKFRTEDPSPPEMEEFYDSLSRTLREDKWFYQEYGVGGKDKGFRKIGFQNLTPLQASTLTARAKQYLPKVRVAKSRRY